MKRYVIYLVKILVFMLLLFTTMRIVFIMNYWHLVSVDKVPFLEIIRGFFKALPLDIASACYIMPFPALVMFILTCFNKNTSYRWVRWYFYAIIAAYVLAVMGEIGIYGEWGTKLSAKALAYLENPSEVINTASTQQTVLLISLWACFTVLFGWWYVKWIEPSNGKFVRETAHPLMYGAVFVLSFGLMFLGMRGGFNEIPISTSSGYFSNYKIVNIMTVNPAYNLLENLSNDRKVKENAHFNYMNFETAERITKETHQIECDSTVNILKTENPNVLIVLLESWSADLIESLGGDPSITPNFHEMEKDGLLFTNFYASANRSQQAIASIIGGLPGLPVTTITNHQEKYYAIPSIVKSLDSLGYYSSFYFGGELNYGNILSYLRYNEFNRIVEGKDVNEHFHKGKLGIQDTDMLPWAARDINSQPEPFFTTIFTLSTHSPYDYPKIFEELEWPELEKVFVNSAKYTDIALKLFMDRAKQQPWYDNTLFLFMADHSHPSYKNHPMESFEYHKIPLLIYGKPLQDSLRGTTFDKICGNTDIPATLLAQLGVKHEEFIWSKNIFNTCYKPFAFFELYSGLGWKTDEGEYVISGNNVLKNTFPEDKSDSLTRQGKAYMQYHFDLFNRY
ncbi:MAG: sulfatase-like hydrolase/transferase [Bacteroidales bacterium]|nr:sulfatase-like hydrolase/transferase [Bacteroidales bacterium]